ncbi:hypothetical protein [Dactylosporangium sp. NPDC000521]|uniref:hypothetical protein n=1 Tax=Dactylosporangium sp. NPDC000521 TaxID=3363975 RepID=UPI003676897C
MSDWWGGAVDRPVACSRSALVEVSAALPATLCDREEAAALLRQDIASAVHDAR